MAYVSKLEHPSFTILSESVSKIILLRMNTKKYKKQR